MSQLQLQKVVKQQSTNDTNMTLPYFVTSTMRLKKSMNKDISMHGICSQNLGMKERLRVRKGRTLRMDFKESKIRSFKIQIFEGSRFQKI